MDAAAAAPTAHTAAKNQTANHEYACSDDRSVKSVDYKLIFSVVDIDSF